MQSDDQSFELGPAKGDDTPTRQLTSPHVISANEDAISLLEPGDLIGRYLVRKRIGAGGFGVVYLGEDTALKRDVCIKISRTKKSDNPSKQFTLIAEAQAVASLDHPNVVRVFDTGLWKDFPYLVMEYVSGATLGHEIRTTNLISIPRALMLMKQVALALSHLHSRGLIHRDLKPANILISPDDVVKLTDFGLAISDDMPIWNKQQIAGTQRYMAPEQVLGETHHIDGRTDIWGFGVVLYELLTSKPPFRATDPKVLFQSILKGDAPSLRQRRPDIPHVLDQFCLRCLSQCMTDRYQSATELLEDLDDVIRSVEDTQSTERPASTGSYQGVVSPKLSGNDIEAPNSDSDGAVTLANKQSNTDVTGVNSSNSNASQNEAIQIVPRGLRSFDEEDHAFFLKLIPGPRGARDVPLSLRFWTNWVANKEGGIDYAVGVLYGPSGAGKSSFIKAGLMPVIRETTNTVYVDFTVDGKQDALLTKLRKSFPEVAHQADLATCLAAIRNDSRIRPTVLVLDQFEQYLANTPLNLQHELVQSLRQCDGVRLKAILLIRDEFWNSISYFMHLMESSLADQRNALSLPLLNQRHAERILEAIGRAYENLPAPPEPLSESQRNFIEHAVQLLSQDGNVICVRLSMFAELMRNHTWEPKTLVRLGGIDGAAIKYLEESFDVQTAPISHKAVAEQCRAILRSLLPSQAVDIKSSAKSKQELQQIVGRNESPYVFDQAMRILETELRLVSAVGQTADAKPLYSLTHDYLVKPVKDWLYQHEQASWQGRARSKLKDLSIQFEREPAQRNLPTIAEWCAIQAATSKSSLTPAEKSLMRSASRTVVGRLASIATVGVLLVGALWYSLSARDAAYQAERSKAVTAVELFLASKSNGLELATTNVLKHASNAKLEFEKKIYIADTEYDNRLVLLGALLGADVDPTRLLQAVDAADTETQIVFRNSFAQQKTRDRLFETLNGDSKISDRMHWLFIANNDFRLLPSIEKSIEPSPAVLCHQIAACAMDAPKDAWDASKLEQFVSDKPLDSELHILVTLLEGLLEQADSADLKRIERQSVASDASIAMPAQWFIEKSKNERLGFKPQSSKEADWKVETPEGVPLPMIRVQAGAMTYTMREQKSMANNSDTTVGIVIDQDVWLTQDKIEMRLVKRFLEAQESQSTIEVREQNGYASFAKLKQVFLFCNWLSEVSNFELAYEFGVPKQVGDDRQEVIDGVYWIKSRNGFRIPTEDERVFIATCGDANGVLGELYGHKKIFDATRTRPMDRPNRESREFFRSLPNAMGLKNVLSAPAELLIKRSSGRLSATALDNSTSSVLVSLTWSQEDMERFVQTTCLRLAHGVID